MCEPTTSSWSGPRTDGGVIIPYFSHPTAVTLSPLKEVQDTSVLKTGLPLLRSSVFEYVPLRAACLLAVQAFQRAMWPWVSTIN